MTDAVGGQNLLAIYSVYEKLKGKSTASTQGASSAAEARPATPAAAAPGGAAGGAGGKEEAEKLKAQGNAAMQKKDFATAVEFYTKALDLVPLNPIYLSNRAAAYSGLLKHEDARQDAELATAADPKYTKAWSRLGLARFALGDAKGSMEAYKQGMDAEGGGSDVMRRGYETAKRRYEEEAGDVGAPDAGERGMPGGGAGGMPDLSGLASMLGGGGAGGAGGMPDFSQMMQNPMIRQMADRVMQNPEMLSGLMNNPALAGMMGGMGRGGGGGAPGAGAGGADGGMPDLSAMMNDPNIAEMWVISLLWIRTSTNLVDTGRGTSWVELVERGEVLPLHRTKQLDVGNGSKYS
jgi:small glutamine-rich tetratricopeptide repeat-containing protein alpha